MSARETPIAKPPVNLFHTAEEKKALAKEIEHFKSEQNKEKKRPLRAAEWHKKQLARNAAAAEARPAGTRLETTDELLKRIKEGDFRKRGGTGGGGGGKKRRRKTRRKPKSKKTKRYRKKRQTKRTKRTRNKKGGSEPLLLDQDLIPGGTKQYDNDKPRQSNDELSEPLFPDQDLIPGGTKQYNFD